MMHTSDSVHSEFNSLSSRPRSLRQVTAAPTEPRVIGQSELIRCLVSCLRDLGRSGAATLLIGESGTGKGFFARALHQMGPRREQPYVTLVCTPDSVAEEALTQALASAQGGTLYIDGIEHLAPELAARLAAALPTASVQVVASSSQPLDGAVAEGRFNAELYGCFAEGTLHLPPLREHAEDIPLLARHFFELAAARASRAALRGISPEAMSLLTTHVWENNATGLQSVIEQAVTQAEGPYLTASDLPEELRSTQEISKPRLLATLPPQGIDLRAAVEELETRMILQALERTGWNKNRASRLLGLNRTTLVEMIKRKRLAPPGRLHAAAPCSSAEPTYEEQASAAE